MKQDAFSRCHPAVNFIYFVGAIGFGVVIQHPAYMLAAVLGALLYYVLLKGIKGLKLPMVLLPVFLLITFVNPLFNTLGETELFPLFGKPYTLEALCYGAVVGGMLLGVIEIFAKAYISTQLSDAIVFAVLIIVLLVKPTGLLGKQIREKV